MESELYLDIKDFQWPIVYSNKYNVHFWGLEKLHPFDAGKWGRVFQIKYLDDNLTSLSKKAEQFILNIWKFSSNNSIIFDEYIIKDINREHQVYTQAMLKDYGLIDEDLIATPNEATKNDLLAVHSKRYLISLQCSWKVACIAEMPPICFVPNCFVQNGYLRPMRYQTGGTVLAGKLALERGWAINIGGGFHHCSSKRGGGFCPYADITLLIKFVFENYANRVKKVMIVDLDAHQGNGHERDFLRDDRIYIMDVYNREIYPFDRKAKKAIRRPVELTSHTGDDVYLSLVNKHLKLALEEFPPDLMVYNAGTDILSGDSLGRLNISRDGIVRRDEIVFTKARSACVPIVMLTSGGYLKKSASIIAESIMNLHDKNLIVGPKKRF